MGLTYTLQELLQVAIYSPITEIQSDRAIISFMISLVPA